MTAGVITTTVAHGSERAMIEGQMKLLLERLRAENGAYLKTLDFYNGEFDTEEGMLAFLEHMIAGAPAILLATGQSVYRRKSASGRRYVVTVQIDVLFVSTNLRDQPARLHGDLNSGPDAAAINENEADFDEYPTSDPGIYRMMRDARDILLAENPALDGISSIEISREDVIAQGPAITLWRQVYEAEYSWQKKHKTLRHPVPATGVDLHHNAEGPADADLGNPVIVQERDL